MVEYTQYIQPYKELENIRLCIDELVPHLKVLNLVCTLFFFMPLFLSLQGSSKSNPVSVGFAALPADELPPPWRRGYFHLAECGYPAPSLENLLQGSLVEGCNEC